MLHEFAHKLDMRDQLMDGTPPVADASQRQRFVEVCDAELQRLRSGEPDGVLRAYAATNPSEFFAVATEVFFERPVDLEDAKPDLYAVLRDAYRQDPAARERAAG